MSVIRIEHKGKSYELGFTRNSIVAMERQGFNIEEISSKPMTMIPMFWQGAFAAYNKNIKRNLMDEIYENIRDKQGLIAALCEMYAEAINTLTDEPEDDKGNATWEIVR